eukprot:764385-Pleurochrysis_carterae.AAC.1
MVCESRALVGFSVAGDAEDLREHRVQALLGVRRKSLSSCKSSFGSAQFIGAEEFRSAVSGLGLCLGAVE